VVTTPTRERIKEAALALFAENGFAGTSIGAIEKAAGLVPRAGAFYRHFASKEELLAELAREKISETPEEFDFDGLRALKDTRAELVTIACIYERAGRRQLPYLRLIEEVRLMAGGAAAEAKINEDMLAALSAWVASKPAGKGLRAKDVTALAITVFGSWLFYLTKLQQGIDLASVDRDRVLDTWATHWAGVLDRGRRA
jgi:AcrR family transcriptional regulator